MRGPLEVGVVPVAMNVRRSRNRLVAGELLREREVDGVTYDNVVLGLGAEVNFFGTAGAAEHAFPMYTLADAVRLKEPVLETWEAADKEPGLAEGRPPRVHRGGIKQAHGRSDHSRSGRLDLSYPRHAQVGHRVEAHTLVLGRRGPATAIN